MTTPFGDQSEATLGAQAQRAQQAAGPGLFTGMTEEQIRGYIEDQVRRTVATERASLGFVAPVVRYAKALADHVQAHADANPVIHADADYSYRPLLEHLKVLVQEAEQAAKTGDGSAVTRLAFMAADWLAKHHVRYPGLDYSYVKQLAADDLPGAAAEPIKPESATVMPATVPALSAAS